MSFVKLKRRGYTFPECKLYFHSVLFQALCQPRVDEWNKFMFTLEDFKHNQADEELEKGVSKSYGSGPSSLTSLPNSLSPALSLPVR